MNFTYFGHSCFLVEIDGKKLLFDPFISGNPLAKEIDIDAIEADYIFVSHGHEDHVLDVERIAKKTGAMVVSNFEIVSWFEARGCENVHPMNHGGAKDFDFGRVKYVNAIHSSVLPDGAYGGNPGGFVLSSSEGNFYFSGDTALTYDMKLIPLDVDLDFAILPIGDNFTMGIKDAAICCEFVEIKKAVGIHFNTFPYIEIDTEEAIKHFESQDLELIIPNIGQTIDI